MKINEVLDPKEFATRLSQTTGKDRPERINKLIALMNKKAKKSNPLPGDLRHHDEEEGVDPDLKTLPTG